MRDGSEEPGALGNVKQGGCTGMGSVSEDLEGLDSTGRVTGEGKE